MNESKFEEQLRHAMRPVDPPASLRIALMNLAEAETAREQRAAQPTTGFWGHARLAMAGWFAGGRSMAVAGSLAAIVAAAGISVGAVHVRDHRLAEQRATAQFNEAQQITDQTLADVQEHLKSKGIPLDPY